MITQARTNIFAKVLGLSLLFVFGLTATGCDDDYPKVTSRLIDQALGSGYDDNHGYQALSYPTNNFGLGTAYEATEDGKIHDTNFVCDMWHCFGYSDAQIPTDPDKVLHMDGLAAVGGNGAQIDIQKSEQDNLALNVLLPQIYGVANVQGGYQKKSILNTTLTLGRAYPRLLRRDVAAAKLSAQPDTSMIKRLYLRGDLVMVVGDVVVDSLKVTIKLDDSASTQMKAALNTSAIGGVGKVLGDASFNFSASDDSSGQFTFTVSMPVIVKRLVKKQPGAGVLSAAGHETWDDWTNVTLLQKAK